MHYFSKILFVALLLAGSGIPIFPAQAGPLVTQTSTPLATSCLSKNNLAPASVKVLFPDLYCCNISTQTLQAGNLRHQCLQQNRSMLSKMNQLLSNLQRDIIDPESLTCFPSTPLSGGACPGYPVPDEIAEMIEQDIDSIECEVGYFTNYHNNIESFTDTLKQMAQASCH